MVEAGVDVKTHRVHRQLEGVEGVAAAAEVAIKQRLLLQLQRQL